jgi:pSer/pThr/pTyr-binding forkhead associated (FHA) protein
MQPAYGGPSPRLVVQATNAQIMLTPGKTEYIVGREDPVSNIFPDVDMTPHGGDDGGVSRRHARLFQQSGQWFVEDYQSTNFTHVNNVRVQPGVPAPVPNGAEIRFGRIKLMFYVQ